MNRSRYVTRQLDKIDREIIAALTEDGRMTLKELAEQIGMASPSVRARLLKLEDAGAIRGYTIVIDPSVFGLGTSAYVRMNAMPGHARKLAQLIDDTPEVVEAHQVTGEDCFLAKVVVSDVHELKIVVDRFQSCSSSDTAIVISSPVVRRLPKL
ncbi:MAG: Lrp/AsnC family transcriptional regulator [Sphingorhabdus sp.]|jgi:Lrp/AsnC family transcriptional regulator, leucine-responsive regulatory protein|nr:Lrp/AsnC family transcriptional regulator [Sphingorhabdus sp.]